MTDAYGEVFFPYPIKSAFPRALHHPGEPRPILKWNVILLFDFRSVGRLVNLNIDCGSTKQSAHQFDVDTVWRYELLENPIPKTKHS